MAAIAVNRPRRFEGRGGCQHSPSKSAHASVPQDAATEKGGGNEVIHYFQSLAADWPARGGRRIGRCDPGRVWCESRGGEVAAAASASEPACGGTVGASAGA